MTKAQKTKDEVAELRKEIRSMRTGNTRLKNDMKTFKEELQNNLELILDGEWLDDKGWKK